MHRTALSIPPSKPFCHIPFLHHTNRPRHLPKPPQAIPSIRPRLPVHHSRPPKGNRLEMPRSPLRNASLPIPVQPGQQSPGQYPGLYCIQTKGCHPARALLSGEIHGEALPLQDRFASESNAQLLEYLMVNIAQHHGTMHLATTQLGQLLQRAPAVVIVLREHR